MTDYKNYVGFYVDLLGEDDPIPDMSILVDSSGRRRTRSLFLEAYNQYTNKVRGSVDLEPLYCLRDRGRDGLPSAYQIYMASTDEYEAAMKLVGSMEHWDMLCSRDWFMEPSKITRGLLQWRQDMQRRNASIGLKTTIQNAKKGDGASARKLLDISETDLGISKTKTGPGRPSPRKEREEEERKRAEEEEEQALEELYARVRGESE